MEMGRAEPCPYEIRGTRYNVFPLCTFAHWVKAQPCALDETSRFRATTQGRPYRICGLIQYNTTMY